MKLDAWNVAFSTLSDCQEGATIVNIDEARADGRDVALHLEVVA